MDYGYLLFGKFGAFFDYYIFIIIIILASNLDGYQ